MSLDVATLDAGLQAILDALTSDEDENGQPSDDALDRAAAILDVLHEEETPPDTGQRFATAPVADLEDDAAASVLRRALAALEEFAAKVRAELLDAVARPDDAMSAAAAVLAAVRGELEQLLAEAALAAALAGAGSVAELPEFPPSSGLLTTDPPSPELLHLADLARSLPASFRDDFLSALAPEQVPPLLGLLAQPPRPPTASSWVATPPSGEPGPLFPGIAAAAQSLQDRRVLTRERYDALSADARTSAFTVAGVQEQAVLEKVRQAVADAVRDGPDLRAFRERVAEETGTGTFLSPAHAETVFRVNVQQAFADGQEAILADPLIGDAFPFVASEGIHDSRQTELCRTVEKSGIDGTNIFARADPVWQRLKCPRHFGCRCLARYMTATQAAARGIHAPTFVAMPDVELPKGWRS